MILMNVMENAWKQIFNIQYGKELIIVIALVENQVWNKVKQENTYPAIVHVSHKYLQTSQLQNGIKDIINVKPNVNVLINVCKNQLYLFGMQKIINVNKNVEYQED